MVQEQDQQAIVIDAGSGTCKAGFAGNDAPCSLFKTVVGRPKRGSAIDLNHVDQDQVYVGDSVMDFHRKETPIEYGIVTNWQDMEKVWHHIFYNQLRVSPEEYPVLMTEAIFNPKGNREKMTEIMFEKFNVNGLYVRPSAEMSLYAAGRTTGVVIESGEGITQTVPILDGFVIKSAVHKMMLAGRDLTAYLLQMFTERGFSFTSPVEQEIVKEIKENWTEVSCDFDKVMEESKAYEKNYQLPDGQNMMIGKERFRCPELLFQPKLAGFHNEDGVHKMCYTSITKCDIDARKDFYGNIVLSGGSTMFEAMGERIVQEIKTLTDDCARISTVAPRERINSAWIGGSILGSSSRFEAGLMTKEEYDESGPTLIHQKFT